MTAAGRLSCLTLNLWGDTAPLERRMEIVAAGLTAMAPDVVALQEVREAPDCPNQAEALARAAGYEIAFAPAMAFRGGHEGLAILSRTPIVERAAIELPHANEQERRILLSARVMTPTGDVWVHTTHLNYRLAHGQQRQDQVMAIDEEISVRSPGNERPQLLMGDFNARPESDEMRWMRGLTTLEGRRVHYQDAWDRLHPTEPGWTWASANPYTAPLRFLETDRRLDYIFVSSMRRDGRGAIHSCRIVFDKAAHDGVFASDHFGVLAEVQLAAEGA